MSRYHSICTECGFEDHNDGIVAEDYCGHTFWAIVDHYHEEYEEAEQEGGDFI